MRLLATCAIVLIDLSILPSFLDWKLETTQLLNSPDLITDGAMNAPTAWTHNAAHTTFILGFFVGKRRRMCVAEGGTTWNGDGNDQIL